MKTLILAISALASTHAFAAVEWKSVYTDIKKECVVISESNDLADIDFAEYDCKSFGGYRLKVVGGDIRYAPTLSFNGVPLEMGRPIAFHDPASDKVEWIYKRTSERDGSGEIEWKGFVYRLSVSNGDGTGSSNFLYAVRLDGEKTCFLGNAKNNEQARAMVKNSSLPCQQ